MRRSGIRISPLGPWLVLAAGLAGCAGGTRPPVEALFEAEDGRGQRAAESFEEAVKILGDPHRPLPEKRAAWRRIVAEGREAEAQALFEERRGRAPQAPQAHVDLGNLALVRLLEETARSRRARLALSADAHYARALELDPKHWEARFQRAVGLAHWPALLGRRKEALHALERLMQDQELLPSEPRFSWTYLILGTLQDELGLRQEAHATWRRGLERHPEARSLRERLGQPDADRPLLESRERKP